MNLTANYLSPSLRRLEGGDIATISGTRTVFVDFFANSPGDYIRVLTQFSPAAAPEPGTVAIISLGLAGIGFARRKTGPLSSSRDGLAIRGSSEAPFSFWD